MVGVLFLSAALSVVGVAQSAPDSGPPSSAVVGVAQSAPGSGPQSPAVVGVAQSAPGSGPQSPGSQSPDHLERLTREVSMELRCPVCQGESIQESPAELAQEMKGIVREQLAAGQTPDEVKAYFVARYGEWILLRPTSEGVNAMLYWLPPIVLMAGGAVVVLLARRWIDASRATPPAASPDSTDTYDD